jgi:hypothetical protein
MKQGGNDDISQATQDKLNISQIKTKIHSFNIDCLTVTNVNSSRLILTLATFLVFITACTFSGGSDKYNFIVCCLCADCEIEPQPRAPAVELESLLNRLERVTTRLEQTVGVASQSLFRQPASQTSVPEPLSLPTPQPPPPPPPPPSQLTEEATYKMSVAAFGDIMQGPLSQYLELSAKLGGEVATHSKLVEKAFQ